MQSFKFRVQQHYSSVGKGTNREAKRISEMSLFLVIISAIEKASGKFSHSVTVQILQSQSAHLRFLGIEWLNQVEPATSFIF